MKRVGIIGLGDMGIGMAKNVIDGGFELIGFDLRAERLGMLKSLGGTPAASLKQLGESVDFVFVMVLNGKQVWDIVVGENGLLQSLKPGVAIDVSATIEPREMRDVAAGHHSQGFRRD